MWRLRSVRFFYILLGLRKEEEQEKVGGTGDRESCFGWVWRARLGSGKWVGAGFFI